MKALRVYVVKVIMKISWLEKLFINLYKLMAMFVIHFIQWRFPATEVWVRNSLALGDLVPGLSDIDFTIYNNDKRLNLDHQLLAQVTTWLRHFIPIIGEFNYYNVETLRLVQDLANPHELDRDIVLKTKLQTVEKKKTQSDHLVYLLRLYHSDSENLRLNPELRAKKWNRVFSAINAGVNYNGRLSVDSVIQSYLTPAELSLEPVVYPHLWLAHNWKSLDSNLRAVDEFKSGRDFLKQVTLGQIRWEIFGILSQLPFLKNAKDMQYHFSHLAKIVEHIDISESKQLRNTIDQAILQARQY
tara:strand:- start:6346 stop:7245 length:900 start_codon:yes stop_codon:yes gene_type:complete